MRPLIIISLILIPLAMPGQGPLGSWEDHLPYHSIKQLAEGSENIFGTTDYAIASYNLKYSEIKKLSTVSGLSESGISSIAYSDNNVLIIAYNSTNIDLYSDGLITNIPEISNKYIAGRKQINNIMVYQDYAYILSSFGIVVLDLQNNEIKDTWNPSQNSDAADVYDIAILENTIYAATSRGILSADISDPGLAYFGNWTAVPGFDTEGAYTNIETSGNKLFVSKQAAGSEGDSLLLYDQSSLFAISAGTGQRIYSIRNTGNSVLVALGESIDIYSTGGSLNRTINDYGWGSPDCRDALIKDGKLYLADNKMGIIIEHAQGSYESVVIPGPLSPVSADIYSEDGNVYVSGGKLTEGWDNTMTPFGAFIFENRSWTNITDNSLWDVLRIRPSPLDPSTRFATTWGSGLLKLDMTGISYHYDDTNSPLESIIPGNDLVRVCGMAFDRDNYLWLTQSGVSNNIKVLKPDNSWIILPYTISAPLMGDILISESNKKWIVLPGGHGLFVLDDNDSPENFGDDRWTELDVHDQFGKEFNTIFSIAEDLDGNIWLGTDEGPAIYYNPDRVFDDDIYCHRIKIPRNDGTGQADYLLSTESISSISIDGGNRKWLGTKSSGVFLLSEDGKELLNSYSEDNSPLPSDAIVSIDVDDISGEVWIGTSKGIITLREKATAGDNLLSRVYAFPNPVRPEFRGELTITGLARNTSVKITDVSGKLVYETTSTGGQATWDLKNHKGQRASTGVYLAFCSTEDGENATVIKILLVR